MTPRCPADACRVSGREIFLGLSGKYRDLTESLAEGIVSGHPDMPIFVFSPHDVEAIIQYLQSIQIKKP